MAESTRRVIRDYAIATLVAAVVAVLIRSFLIEAYRIPTQAMRPGLEPGDTIFVAKWPFGIKIPLTNKVLHPGRLPQRGEVVIFRSPTDTGVDYIKRVIGLPGDRLEVRNSIILLNDRPLSLEKKNRSPCSQERLPEGKSYEVCDESPTLTDFQGTHIPADSVFVVGDLRTQQRGWGIIPISALKGKAMWIWLSFEPKTLGTSAFNFFSRFRFERMLRSIE